MYLLECVACGMGVGTGWISQRLAMALGRRLPRDEFWIRVRRFCRALVTPSDETRLLREYLRLFPELLRFLRSQLLVMTVALGPVAVAFVGLTAMASQLEPQAIYLSDWELSFFVAVGLTSAATAWLGTARRDPRD